MAPTTETVPPLVPPLNSAVLRHDLDNLTQVANNDTDDERNERLAEFEVAISATILVLAVVGNSIVVVSLMIKRGKLSRMHLMMLHLSLADLSVAFFQVLPQMVWDITFRFQGEVQCWLLAFFNTSNTPAPTTQTGVSIFQHCQTRQ